MRILETQRFDSKNNNVVHYTDFSLQVGNVLEYYSHAVSLEYEESKSWSRRENQLSSFYKHKFLPKNLKYNWFFLKSLKDTSQYFFLEKDFWASHFVKFRRVSTSNTFFEFAWESSEIVSLICLFSTNAIRAQVDNDCFLPFNQLKTNWINNIKSIVADNALTHYEIESIYRQVSFINKLLEQKDFYKTVKLQLPLVQYYIFGLEEYQKGSLSSKTLLHYFDIIDERTERLSKIYQNRIQWNLKLDLPLLSIRDYIKDSIKCDIMPDLQFALKILSEDDLWKYAIEFIKPTTWYSVWSEISEAIEEMRPSFENDGKISVIVKNPKEEPSMTVVKRVSKYIYGKTWKHTHILWMYPHEQVLINHSDEMQKKRLYDISEKPTFSNVKKIKNHYD